MDSGPLFVAGGRNLALGCKFFEEGSAGVLKSVREGEEGAGAPGSSGSALASPGESSSSSCVCLPTGKGEQVLPSRASDS